MATERHDALVLDLDTRGGLAIARDLGAQGYRIAVGTRDAEASGMQTRHALGKLVLPRPEDEFAAAARTLLRYLEQQPTDVVLSSIDSSVAILHRHRDELERLGTSPALGSPAALDVAISKERTLEVAAAVRVPVPRSLRVDDPAHVDDALGEIGLPAVIKPAVSWQDLGPGGERVNPVYVADTAHARTAAVCIVRAGHTALLQEFAPGARETIKLFHDGRRIVARLAMASSRTWPPLGGSSVMRWTIAPPSDALAYAERLIAEIGLHGYSEAEFRRDAAGRPLLMEVNPRLSQSVELAARAGIDFARMQLEWARGNAVEPANGYRVGVRLGWLGGEARVVAAALGAGPPPRPRSSETLREIAADYALRRSHVEGFDLHDARPVLAALSFTARTAIRRGTRRLSASRH